MITIENKLEMNRIMSVESIEFKNEEYKISTSLINSYYTRDNQISIYSPVIIPKIKTGDVFDIITNYKLKNVELPDSEPISDIINEGIYKLKSINKKVDGLTNEILYIFEKV